MNDSISFAALIASARQIAGLTEAQFNYELQSGPRNNAALDAYDMALNSTANGDPVKREALREQHVAELRAMIDAAKAKQYSGWSNASSGPVRYAR